MYKNLSLLIGFLVAAMVTLNGVLAGYFSSEWALATIYCVGFITSSVLIIIQRKFFTLKNVPFYLLLGGVIGVFLVLFNNLTFQTIGVSLTITFGLLGQLITAIIIDHFGWLGREKYPFKPKKIISITLIIVGIFVMSIS